jgi:hypothetical protein
MTRGRQFLLGELDPARGCAGDLRGGVRADALSLRHGKPGFRNSYFAVRKANRSVWRFMEQFGGVRTGVTELDFLYEAKRESVLQSFRRYSRILPDPIRVFHDPVS